MTTYRQRHHDGLYDPDNIIWGDKTDNDKPPALPRTHAELDQIAEDRGYEWSGEGLTVAEKQAELG